MTSPWSLVFFVVAATAAGDTYTVTMAEPSPVYEPDWESIDSRPLPSWYDDSKFGIFMHWGVYSVPGFGSEWFWNNWKNGEPDYVRYMTENYPPGFTYQHFAEHFSTRFFNATHWAEIVKGSNAKYLVLTSKHHEGFTMWNSSRSFGWNSVDVGPHRDVVGELAKAVRAKGIKFGLYYSLYEWYNPMYLADKESNFTLQEYVDHKMLPEMKELVNAYRPDVVWCDGEWEAEDAYFRSRDFLAWLYNSSPVRRDVVVNDRWGRDTLCHHGGFYTCTDRYNPGVLQPHKWENCMTVDRRSWGYRKNADLKDILSPEQLVGELVSTVSCGGNLLMNVGPTDDGTIAPIYQDRLNAVGRWLDVNGEAIFKTQPWKHQNDTLNGNVWYTESKRSDGVVYAVVLEWPHKNLLVLQDVAPSMVPNSTTVKMLGNQDVTLKWWQHGDAVAIRFPDKATTKSKIAWSLKLEKVA